MVPSWLLRLFAISFTPFQVQVSRKGDSVIFVCSIVKVRAVLIIVSITNEHSNPEILNKSSAMFETKYGTLLVKALFNGCLPLRLRLDEFLQVLRSNPDRATYSDAGELTSFHELVNC
jgi:hypothetical protein